MLFHNGVSMEFHKVLIGITRRLSPLKSMFALFAVDYLVAYFVCFALFAYSINRLIDDSCCTSPA